MFKLFFIGWLVKLEYLDMIGCELLNIPKEIGNLQNLKYLSLEDNKLKELPQEICKLIDLEELILCDNPNLVFSIEQERWIEKLKDNGCEVILNDDR